jgi:hypothetical protein
MILFTKHNPVLWCTWGSVFSSRVFTESREMTKSYPKGSIKSSDSILYKSRNLVTSFDIEN